MALPRLICQSPALRLLTARRRGRVGRVDGAVGRAERVEQLVERVAVPERVAARDRERRLPPRLLSGLSRLNVSAPSKLSSWCWRNDARDPLGRSSASNMPRAVLVHALLGAPQTCAWMFLGDRRPLTQSGPRFIACVFVGSSLGTIRQFRQNSQV